MTIGKAAPVSVLAAWAIRPASYPSSHGSNEAAEACRTRGAVRPSASGQAVTRVKAESAPRPIAGFGFRIGDFRNPGAAPWNSAAKGPAFVRGLHGAKIGRSEDGRGGSGIAFGDTGLQLADPLAGQAGVFPQWHLQARIRSAMPTRCSEGKSRCGRPKHPLLSGETRL